MSKRAVILAGGKGTRLKPYTVSLPKPLVPIGEMPILEIIIRQLAKSGFDHITITVNHMADIIRAFCGDGNKWGVTIDYSLEDKPLSTMGPLKLIQDLPENFLVMNGDVLTDLDFGQFYDEHVRSGNIFTVSAFTRDQKVDYGVLEIGDDNKLSDFIEKPTNRYNVSMGVYMASNKVLEYIPENQFYGFDHLMLDLIKDQHPATVKIHSGYWLDIGRPDDYEKACKDFTENNFVF
ncbi:MAG TPA: sugar phosphate nucleotidyltransferase [Paludibacteraceae bacterium]|jgi:NDP-sugar pyrophosphorylase family protein|nr:sugar phosphate nucleotidyltransferase [Paludibacteraceae bacterium]HPT42666.1 sugar phosphate nucleotidyltransferase [Paludibacteraceae bacterium]